MLFIWDLASPDPSTAALEKHMIFKNYSCSCFWKIFSSLSSVATCWCGPGVRRHVVTSNFHDVEKYLYAVSTCCDVLMGQVSEGIITQSLGWVGGKNNWTVPDKISNVHYWPKWQHTYARTLTTIIRITVCINSLAIGSHWKGSWQYMCKTILIAPVHNNKSARHIMIIITIQS